ncbi:MAG: hypothetical protein ACO218_03985 [Steroidobacteraceae bacterium]
MIGMGFKLAYTALVLVVLVVWLRNYGWRNLLWFSDIALLGAVPALWLDHAPTASILTTAVLVPELMWNLDFLLRLLLRRRILGLTEYMFDAGRPLVLRLLSLFHVPLPAVLLWMVYHYGYDASVGLPGAVLLLALVLPASRLFSSEDANINWSWHLPFTRHRLPAGIHLPLLFAAMVVLFCLPTDWAMQRWFDAAP